MRKLFTILVIITAILSAEKLNLGDRNLVERFGYSIVKDKIDMYDPDQFGLWVLKNDYRNRYQKVRNDEFELDDAKKWAFEKFKTKLKAIKPIDKNAEYHIFLSASFGKYDFKTKRFLVKSISENSYMQYRGKGKVVSHYSKSKLVFDNATSDTNFIPMEKQEAKQFLKSRKNSYGDIDRNLMAHYVYKINSYEEVDEFNPGRSQMSIKFLATLQSVEFIDEKTKKVLKKVEYAKK